MLANLEIFMPLTVVLAVGLDTANLESQISDWRSAGLRITPAWSVRDAIVLFKDGDFDLVLLGRSIPADSRERTDIPYSIDRFASARGLHC